MRKVALGIVVTTCAMGSAVAADMTAPLYKAPAPVYNWIDWYFRLYFAGSAGHDRGVSTNPAFALVYFGRATDFGADVFPPLSPNAFIGSNHVGADQQWGNFAGDVFQGASINASGAATVTIPPRCDVAPTRCAGATTQSSFQNLDFGALHAPLERADDNWPSVGIDASNSDGSYNKRGVAGPGVAGVTMKGTMSYKFDWQ
jgi:opacity protein-like surface antigen